MLNIEKTGHKKENRFFINRVVRVPYKIKRLLYF